MDSFGYDVFGHNQTLSFHEESTEDILCGRERLQEYVHDRVSNYLGGITPIDTFNWPQSIESESVSVVIEDNLILAISQAMKNDYYEIRDIIPIYGKDKSTAQANAKRYVDALKSSLSSLTDTGPMNRYGGMPDMIVVQPTLTTSQMGGGIGVYDGVKANSIYSWPTNEIFWEKVYVEKSNNPNTGKQLGHIYDSTELALVIISNDTNMAGCGHCKENYTEVIHAGGSQCKCEGDYRVVGEIGPNYGKCMLKEEDCEWFEALFGCGWYPTLWKAVRNIFK